MMKINKTNGAEYAPLGIYVHIPFCIRKCKYCDFVSFAGKTKADQKEYVDNLCNEIEEKSNLYKDRYYIDTIFFGGGTPSILEPEDLNKILSKIKENFVLDHTDNLEISVEANPGTITSQKLDKLKEYGFNRISIGVQSFDDSILQILGRIHNAQEAEEAVKSAISAGFNTNLDLMFGIPNQTLEIWEETLIKAVKLHPNHISFYSLQLEEGTELYQNYRYGDLELPGWEENRAMYHGALEILNKFGYKHYEISNAALPGFECKHNIKYWTMAEYLGFGVSAHSYISGKRTGDTNPDPKGDFIFTRLRMIEGFDKKEYFDRFGIEFEKEFADVYNKLVTDNLLYEENSKIKFTKKGLDYTNPVMQKLLEVITR